MKKNWSQPEIECLKYAYELGATLQNMALIFNRSVTAVNKALERFGIRPLGAGRCKVSRVRSPKPPLGFLIDQLQEFSRNKHIDLGKMNPRFFENLFERPAPSRLPRGSSLSRNTARADLVLSKAFKKAEKSVEIWCDTDFLIHYLKSQGHDIKALPHSTAHPSYPRFRCNAEYLTVTQLLIRANEIRRRCGQIPLYLLQFSTH